MSIEMCILSPHVPSIVHEHLVPEFQQDMVNGMKEVAKEIEKIQPDVIFLISCHWMTTFNHYVDCTPVHKGVVTAEECPDLIKNVPYNYPGDEELGNQIVEAGKKIGIPIIGFNDPDYVWDYGTVVPLRYLVPNENIPVVNMPVTLCASIEETYKLGEQIGEVLRNSSKKAIFIASGALSHNLVRGRENMPTKAEAAMNKEFVNYLMEKDYESAYDMLPQFSSAARVESGGRHLAMLLSILNESYEPKYYSAGQSSGSWNPVMTFTP